MKKKIIIGSAVTTTAILCGAFLSVSTVNARGFGFGHWFGGRSQKPEQQNRAPGIFGTVTAISGSTITVQTKSFDSGTTNVTYTVDATHATVTKNGAPSTVSGITTGDTIMVQGTVSGTTVTATTIRDGWIQRSDAKPNVFGKVTAINGTTITVQTIGFGPNPSQTTYSVNATNATVIKNGSNAPLSSVAVGDTVMIQGSISGTTVTATAIHDGVMRGVTTKGETESGQSDDSRTTIPLPGNGQPIIGGSVTAINGTTLTITNKAGTAYSINAASATVTKRGTTSTLSNVSVGDNVIVQGTINGTSVTASSILDNSGTVATRGNDTAEGRGVFGKVKNFFHSLFGFF